MDIVSAGILTAVQRFAMCSLISSPFKLVNSGGLTLHCVFATLSDAIAVADFLKKGVFCATFNLYLTSIDEVKYRLIACPCSF